MSGSVILLLLHLLPLAASSRSSGSRSHNSFAPRLPSVETVASYTFAHKIRHPCGNSVAKRSIRSEMGEQQQQQTSSSTTSLLIKLINLFTKSLGSSQQEGNRLTATEDLREKNSTSSFRAQLAQLRALKSMPIRRRRDNTESSSTGNLGMRRNLLAAIARLASEVSDAIPMTVSEKNEISFPVHECRWRKG